MAAVTLITDDLDDERAGALLGAVANFAASKGWRVENRTDRTIVCRVPLNWYTWGERVRVEVAHRSLRVASRCVFPYQLIDWGKNARNVEMLRDHLAGPMRVRV